jgi:hypothetical protein
MLNRLPMFTSTALATVALAVSAAAAPPQEWSIQNPYANVDWSACRPLKANLHLHTTQSDGRLSPAQAIDLYRGMGYDVLALTDHDNRGPRNHYRHPQRHKTTWPWTAFGRDPAALGMVAIEGNEISQVNHIASYFTDYGAPNVRSEDDAIREIGRRGGLAVIAHPGRYDRPADWHADLLRRHPHLLGMEIYSRRDAFPGDRQTWDAVSALLAEERSVWGFSSDDMHKPRDAGYNWILLLVTEATSADVRHAMETGAFFFVNAPGGHDGPPPPAIHSIEVDAAHGIIQIHATGHDTIEWISDGRPIHRGDRIDLAQVQHLGRTLRAEVRSAPGGPVVGTQPFRLVPFPTGK